MCCAKSPDFVPIIICHCYFSNLYFPVFVDCWNSFEVSKLCRVFTIIFCYYNLFTPCRAGYAIMQIYILKTSSLCIQGISDSTNVSLVLMMRSLLSLGFLVTNLALDVLKSNVYFSSKSSCLFEVKVITLSFVVHFPFPYLCTSGGIPFLILEY